MNNCTQAGRQCVLAAQKPSHILGCIKTSMTSRLREVNLSVYSAAMRLHLDYCIQVFEPQHRKDIDFLEQTQRMATKIGSYKDRLRRSFLFLFLAWRREGSGKIL